MNKRSSSRGFPILPIRNAIKKSPDLPALMIAVAAIVWSVALWLARAWMTSSDQHFYLVYNLALAAIPLVVATLAIRIAPRKPLGAWLLLTVWLAFFPNAPYLLTDLIHLRARPDCPLWFDWLLFVSMAGSGWLVGMISLAQVHHHLRTGFPAAKANAAIVGVVALSAFGIYVGRFLHWNSWDIVTRPFHLLGELGEMLLNPLDHPVMLAYSFGVAVLMGLSYFGPLVVFRSLQSSRPRS